MSAWVCELRWMARALRARLSAEWDLVRMPVYDAAQRRNLRLATDANRSSRPARSPAIRQPEFDLALRAARRTFRALPAADACLVQALVLGDLLSRHRPSLMIGVGHDADGQLFAHAWIEIDDHVLELNSRPADVALVPLNKKASRLSANQGAELRD